MAGDASKVVLTYGAKTAAKTTVGAKLLLAITVIFLVAVVGGIVMFGGTATAQTEYGQPSALALSDIPAHILELCQSSSERYSPDVPWHVICGVTKIETNHGRSDLQGVTSGVNEHGCCAGIAQFNLKLNGGTGPLGPVRLRARETNSSTWGAYSVDGDGDGWKYIYDPDDAVPSAAHLLQLNTKSGGNPCPTVRFEGYDRPIVNALYLYNHDCNYVVSVLEWATKYRTAAVVGGGPLMTPPNLGPVNSLGYVALPPSLDGSIRRDPWAACPGRSYGTPELIQVIYTVAQWWKQRHPRGYLKVGDLNAVGHKSHNWGVGVDLDASTNGHDWVADFTVGNYNRTATIELGKMFLETGMVKNIWYGDTYVNSVLLRYAQEKKLGNPTIARIDPNHDNHFHLDITGPLGPWSTPSC